MGMLDALFQGNYVDFVESIPDKNTVHRAKPNHGGYAEIVNVATQSAGTALKAITGDMDYNFNDIIHELNLVNPVVSVEGFDAVKMLWLTNMFLREQKKISKFKAANDDDSLLKKIFNAALRTILGRLPGVGSNDPSDSDLGTSEYNKLLFTAKNKSALGNVVSKLSPIAGEIINNLDSSPKPELLINGNAVFDSSIKGTKYYTQYNTPYFRQNIKGGSGATPKSMAKEVLQELGVTVGYRKWYGFELGSNHLWDIQIAPYEGPNMAFHIDGSSGGFSSELTGANPLSQTGKNFETFTPDLPFYHIPLSPDLDDPFGNDKNKQVPRIVFNFGTNCPCISYNIQWGSSASKELPLFNNSAVRMPMGFEYDMNIGLDIVDDIHGSFYNWVNKYMNSIYDLSTASVARYDQAAVIIRLVVFKDALAPKWEFQFIAVPYNYSPNLDGSSSPNEEVVHVDFNIIGMKSGLQNKKSALAPDQNAKQPKSKDKQWIRTTWSDIQLSQRADADKVSGVTS